jgi:hypothetical protein
MSYKPIIFFLIIFILIIYCYFNYDKVIYYLPFPILINSILILIGLVGFFFPTVIQMWKDGEDYNKIKEFIIEKYSKK